MGTREQLVPAQQGPARDELVLVRELGRHLPPTAGAIHQKHKRPHSKTKRQLFAARVQAFEPPPPRCHTPVPISRAVAHAAALCHELLALCGGGGVGGAGTARNAGCSGCFGWL